MLASRVLGTVSTEQHEHTVVVLDVSWDKVGEPSFVAQETELWRRQGRFCRVPCSIALG